MTVDMTEAVTDRAADVNGYDRNTALRCRAALA
jgi:hypothetical protein